MFGLYIFLQKTSIMKFLEYLNYDCENKSHMPVDSKKSIVWRHSLCVVIALCGAIVLTWGFLCTDYESVQIPTVLSTYIFSDEPRPTPVLRPQIAFSRRQNYTTQQAHGGNLIVSHLDLLKTVSNHSVKYKRSGGSEILSEAALSETKCKYNKMCNLMTQNSTRKQLGTDFTLNLTTFSGNLSTYNDPNWRIHKTNSTLELDKSASTFEVSKEIGGVENAPNSSEQHARDIKMTNAITEYENADHQKDASTTEKADKNDEISSHSGPVFSDVDSFRLGQNRKTNSGNPDHKQKRSLFHININPDQKAKKQSKKNSNTKGLFPMLFAHGLLSDESDLPTLDSVNPFISEILQRTSDRKQKLDNGDGDENDDDDVESEHLLSEIINGENLQNLPLKRSNISERHSSFESLQEVVSESLHRGTEVPDIDGTTDELSGEHTVRKHNTAELSAQNSKVNDNTDMLVQRQDEVYLDEESYITEQSFMTEHKRNDKNTRHKDETGRLQNTRYETESSEEITEELVFSDSDVEEVFQSGEIIDEGTDEELFMLSENNLLLPGHDLSEKIINDIQNIEIKDLNIIGKVKTYIENTGTFGGEESVTEHIERSKESRFASRKDEIVSAYSGDDVTSDYSGEDFAERIEYDEFDSIIKEQTLKESRQFEYGGELEINENILGVSEYSYSGEIEIFGSGEEIGQEKNFLEKILNVGNEMKENIDNSDNSVQLNGESGAIWDTKFPKVSTVYYSHINEITNSGDTELSYHPNFKVESSAGGEKVTMQQVTDLMSGLNTENDFDDTDNDYLKSQTKIQTILPTRDSASSIKRLGKLHLHELEGSADSRTSVETNVGNHPTLSEAYTTDSIEPSSVSKVTLSKTFMDILLTTTENPNTSQFKEPPSIAEQHDIGNETLAYQGRNGTYSKNSAFLENLAQHAILSKQESQTDTLTHVVQMTLVTPAWIDIQDLRYHWLLEKGNLP